MLPVFTPQEFSRILAEEQRPILAGCLTQDHTFVEQQTLLCDVAQMFSDTYLVCLWDSDYLQEFSKAYAIAGTPSYVLFYQGEEKTRFLGHADMLNLTNILLVDDVSEFDRLAPSQGCLRDMVNPVPCIAHLLNRKRGKA